MPKWETVIASSLIQYGLDIWELRNKELHGDFEQEQRMKSRERIRDKAKEHFLLGETSVPYQHKKLFHMHASRRLRQSTRQLER